MRLMEGGSIVEIIARVWQYVCEIQSHNVWRLSHCTGDCGGNILQRTDRNVLIKQHRTRG
jgi:hypothetical protein